MGLGTWVWALDGWIVVTALLSALSCALLGNFLVLRGTSMLGDAISHAVLPGLAIAFWISGSRSGPVMFLAAILAAVLTVFLIESLRRVTRVDQGASMGVVFTAMFALGIVLVVQAADHVDLDPNCVLYGSIELTPLDRWEVAGWMVPKATVTLLLTLAINVAFVALFFKELLLTTFDGPLADSMGVSTRWMHYGLMTLVAITAVASFESVGSVLVVAMLVVPPAAALLVTERLFPLLLWSSLFAALAAVLGHVGAIAVPGWFGFGSTLTSGMMAVSAGAILVICGFCGPRRGILVRWWRQRAFSSQVAADDVLGFLFRREEHDAGAAEGTRERSSVTAEQLVQATGMTAAQVHRATFRLCRAGELQVHQGGFSLTDSGRRQAQNLVRSHRLWELYLVEQAQIEADRIHDKAEAWEHVTDHTMRERLDQATSGSARDPHGSQIPPEPESDKR
jgi:manganese/zinc/iron transport system permease protein